jgi:DoxX-like family
MPRSKGRVIAFWVATALFCLQIGFTAYAQLRLPQVADAFTHLGFPAYFRVELSWAKFLGVVLLLAPVPARLKEWAYAGFAITLGSALIAHLAVGDGPEAWGWPAATGVLWGLSYFFWRRLQEGPQGSRWGRTRGAVKTTPRAEWPSSLSETTTERAGGTTPPA